MKKAKKLLSVLLAIVLALSCMSVMASAYTAGDDDYSPYGEVTRISTEQRAKLVLDAVDELLADLNLVVSNDLIYNMIKEQVGVDLRDIISWVGLRMSPSGNLIDATSIDGLMQSLDDLLYSQDGDYGLLRFALNGMNDVPLKNFDDGNNWHNKYKGTRRSGGNLVLISKLLSYINHNKDVIVNILKSGKVEGIVSVVKIPVILPNGIQINLGDIINGLDIDGDGAGGDINRILGDLPGLIKGFIFPLFERWDDSSDVIAGLNRTATNGASEVYTIDEALTEFLKRILTNDMSIIDYTDEGSIETGYPKLPIAKDGSRTYFNRAENDSIQRYSTETGAIEDYKLDCVYNRMPVEGAEGKFYYVNAEGSRLQWYEEGSKAIHAFFDADGNLELDINKLDISTQKPFELLDTFIPYIFEEFAEIPLNGSLKKELGWLFGAEYTFVGTQGDPALPQGEFFDKPAEFYLIGDYSDYAVINGEHWWRYGDNFYKADLSAEGVNLDYFKMINWDYNFDVEFLKKNLPSFATGDVFGKLNDILGAIVNEIITSEFRTEQGINWRMGGNELLIENIKTTAQAIVNYRPELIYGTTDYADGYYQLIMSNDNNDVLNGIAATVIRLAMPQFILPSAENLKGQPIGAILTAVIRELATQLIPNRNYDSYIYTEYGKEKKFVEGDNAYWLDVALTIGLDIGIHYAKNYVDLGEDKQAWKDAMQWDTVALELGGVKTWEARLDYLIDWVLCMEPYGMKLQKLLPVNAADVKLGEIQSPWSKLEQVIQTILPDLPSLINIEYKANGWLKEALVDNGVVAVLNLNVLPFIGGNGSEGYVNGLLTFKDTSLLRTKETLPLVIQVIRNLLNGVLKTATGVDMFIPDTVTTIEALISQDNLATLVEKLLGALPTAVGIKGDVTDGGILNTVLPIVNILMGDTKLQDFADPEITLKDTKNGTDYLLAPDGNINATLTVKNLSKGVLNRHYKNAESYKEDNPYIIEVLGITTSAGNAVTVTSNGAETYTLTGKVDTDTALSVTVKYTVKGKDGASIGGERTQTIYTFCASSPSQESQTEQKYADGRKVEHGIINKKWAIGVTDQPHRLVYVVNNAEEAKNLIENMSFGFDNRTESGYDTWVSDLIASNITNNLPFITIDKSMMNNTYSPDDKLAGYMVGNNSTCTISPFDVNDTFVASDYPAGSKIELGTMTVWFHNNCGTSGTNTVKDNGGQQTIDLPNLTIGTIYIVDTQELKDKFLSYQGLQAGDFANGAEGAEWKAMETAMLNAASTAMMPFTVAGFNEGIYDPDKINALIAALDEAYANLEATRVSTGSKDVLVNALKEAEPGEYDPASTVPEINYQDYRLFEYWDYEAQRNGVRERIAAYEAYEKAVAAGDTNAVAPSYSDLSNQDLAARLLYYKGFLEDHKNTTNPQFLDKEIKYAEAQGYVQADYTTESWEAYQKALDGADAVIKKGAAALQSEVFNAKYDLMVAQNRLAPATAAPELGLSEAGIENGVVIDRTAFCADGDGFVYGIGADIYDMLDESRISENLATPSGIIKVTANAQGSFSTGAKIELCDKNGSVLETYIFVFFGDVNGDGFVDTFDVTDNDLIANGLHDIYFDGDGSANTIAGDYNGDSFVDTFDVTDIDLEVAGLIYKTQAEIAALRQK